MCAALSNVRSEGQKNRLGFRLRGSCLFTRFWSSLFSRRFLGRRRLFCRRRFFRSRWFLGCRRFLSWRGFFCCRKFLGLLGRRGLCHFFRVKALLRSFSHGIMHFLGFFSPLF